MSEQQAGSTPAHEDVFQGQQPTFAEFSAYRQTGELPERFKPAEPADTASAPSVSDEPQSDIEPGTDAGDDVQKPPQVKHRSAEERKAQLKATIEKLWQADEPDAVKIAQLEATIDKIEAGQKRKTAPAPVAQPQEQQQPQPAQAQHTRPKPVPTGNGPDGKPYATYEDYVEDLADWKTEQRVVEYERKQVQARMQAETAAMMEEARSRYEDADDVIIPTVQKIHGSEIPPLIKQVIADSDLFTDIAYKIGNDPGELDKLIGLSKANPRAALAMVFEIERGLRDGFAKAAKPEAAAPEKKQTTAPKPPAPVSGGSSRAFDVSDESLSPEQWMKKRNEQLARRK